MDLDPKIELKNNLIQKFTELMEKVDPNHKVPFITSKIQSFPKCDRARLLVEGDAYIKEFLFTLSADEINDLFIKITKTIAGNSQAMSNNRTAGVVNYLLSGIQPKSTQTVIEEAYGSVGKIFSQTARDEEDRQYKQANIDYPDRKLEEREYKLCGNPFGHILEENLKHLEIDSVSHIKFIRAIRKSLLKYQNGDLSALDLQLRLRYILSRMAISLEQRGFIAAAMQVRRQVFGEKYVGDGLTGAFADPNKANPKKARPRITTEISARKDSYFDKIKNSVVNLGKFFGLELVPVPANLAVTDINKQVADVISKYEEFPTDEEARRKFLNRISKVRQAYLDLELDKLAREGIDENDDIYEYLPYDTGMVSAFENHLNKLLGRISPDMSDSYFPKP